MLFPPHVIISTGSKIGKAKVDKAGPTALHISFNDNKWQVTCSAYYVYVRGIQVVFY
jgi:hypothetical protein